MKVPKLSSAQAVSAGSALSKVSPTPPQTPRPGPHPRGRNGPVRALALAILGRTIGPDERNKVVRTWVHMTLWYCASKISRQSDRFAGSV